MVSAFNAAVLARPDGRRALKSARSPFIHFPWEPALEEQVIPLLNDIVVRSR
jgi:hypothetical protein